MSSQEAFSEAIACNASRIAANPVDGELQAFLNEVYPVGRHD